MVGLHLGTVNPTLVSNHKSFTNHPQAYADDHDLIPHGSDTSDPGFEFHPRSSSSSTFFIEHSKDDDHIELGMWSPINAKVFTTEIMKKEYRNPCQLHHETIPIFLPSSPTLPAAAPCLRSPLSNHNNHGNLHERKTPCCERQSWAYDLLSTPSHCNPPQMYDGELGYEFYTTTSSSLSLLASSISTRSSMTPGFPIGAPKSFTCTSSPSSATSPSPSSNLPKSSTCTSSPSSATSTSPSSNLPKSSTCTSSPSSATSTSPSSNLPLASTCTSSPSSATSTSPSSNLSLASTPSTSMRCNIAEFLLVSESSSSSSSSSSSFSSSSSSSSSLSSSPSRVKLEKLPKTSSTGTKGRNQTHRSITIDTTEKVATFSRMSSVFLKINQLWKRNAVACGSDLVPLSSPTKVVIRRRSNDRVNPMEKEAMMMKMKKKKSRRVHQSNMNREGHHHRHHHHHHHHHYDELMNPSPFSAENSRRSDRLLFCPKFIPKKIESQVSVAFSLSVGRPDKGLAGQ